MVEAVRQTGDFAQPARWQLELGGAVIARIEADKYDFPFTYGRLMDSLDFERFRRSFTDDNDWPEDDPELERLCEEVQARGGFVLRELPIDVSYKGVCLNHDGKQAVWFRHGDPT